MNPLIDQINSKFSHINTFIFDFDGTVADLPIDWPLARASFREYMKRHFPLFDIGDKLRVDEMEALALAQYPDCHDLIFAFRKKLEKQSMYHLRPVEATCVLVQWLYREKGAAMFILSNNLHNTVAYSLKELGLYSCFSLIVGVDNVGVPKPSPKGMPVLERTGRIDRSCCLLVGDNDRTDGGFCENVGVPFLNIMRYT